ncbi:MAG TPA: rRNA maturation RNase YbeY [Terriglobales bacterium]|nr:rRNA maturation RNase YbeY [Terriglobales bacterium]
MVIIQERVLGLSEAALAKFVTRARGMVGLRGAVSVLVTSSRELQGLNRRFRGKNKPTDVLSFPAMPGLMQGFAGDVAISAEIAARNALRLGHTVAEEIRILTLHAVLHLAGYDHELDDGEMERKEARLRKSLGLPAGLIERSGRAERGKGLGAKRKSRFKSSDQVRTAVVSARAKAGMTSRATRASR